MPEVNQTGRFENREFCVNRIEQKKISFGVNHDRISENNFIADQVCRILWSHSINVKNPRDGATKDSVKIWISPNLLQMKFDFFQ